MAKSYSDYAKIGLRPHCEAVRQECCERGADQKLSDCKRGMNQSRVGDPAFTGASIRRVPRGPASSQADQAEQRGEATRCLSPSRSLHRNRNLLRHHRGIVRYMRLVAEQQLQGVFAGLQFHRGFGLALAEMHMIGVGNDRRIQWRQVGIDEQVMMTGIVEGHASGGDAHAFQAELHCDRARDALFL